MCRDEQRDSVGASLLIKSNNTNHKPKQLINMKTSTELTQRRTDALALLDKKIQESALSMEEGQRTQLLQRFEAIRERHLADTDDSTNDSLDAESTQPASATPTSESGNMKTFDEKSQFIQQRVDMWAVFDKKMQEATYSMEEAKRTYFLQRYEAIRNRHYRCLASIDSEIATLVEPFITPDVENIQSISAMSSSGFIYVSPLGNDNNPGTQAAPFRTIQRAVDMYAWRIQLEDGGYDGFTVPPFYFGEIHGNINNPSAVVINGNGAGTVMSQKPSQWWLGFLALYGLTITGGRKNGNQASIDVGDFFYAENIIITGNSSNRAIIGSTNLNGSMIGLCNVLIYDNQVDVSNGGGILFCTNAASFAIDNTTITDNVAPVTITGGYAAVHNSILYNPSSGVEIEPHSFGDVAFSNIRNFATFGGNIWVGEGMIDVEPRFVSPQHGMYQLANDSLCIDAGAWWLQDANRPPAKGTSRTDMGAYGGPNVSAQPYQVVIEPIGSVEYSYDTSGNRTARELA